MKSTHLSPLEQEEYLLQQRTPEMLRHLTECAACRGAVERLENGVALFRNAAVEWSAECLAARPQQLHIDAVRKLPVVALRWAIAAALPVLLLVLALLSLHTWSPRPIHRASEISDDVLLQQVDDQVSVAVPDSMESLTHLVSTESNGGAAIANPVPGSKHLDRTN